MNNMDNAATLKGLPSSIVERRKLDDVPRGTERIILAEDDSRIRGVTYELLEDLGYRVEACANGIEALESIARAHRPFDLVLTDHDMPGLTGYELAQRIRAEHPGLRVVISSGWPKDSILPRLDSKDWPPFLPKPYTLRTLARIIREVLDRPSIESCVMPCAWPR